MTLFKFRTYIKLWVFCFSLLFFEQLHASCSETKKQPFNIPSQPLKNALLEFSLQCDLTLLVPISEIENLRSNSLSGDYLASEALEKMLTGIRLFAKISGEGVIHIQSSTSIENTTSPAANLPASPEEVIVTGLRRSLQSAAEFKREADVIEDVITEYDVVKMPDKGVAESLQRVSGITIEKRLGEGTKINVRGFNENLTLLNGETFLTGMEYFQMGWNDQDYEGSLEAIPIEMLNRINVYKSFKPSDIEGSIGGTVDLLNRNPFDIREPLFAIESGVDMGHYSQKTQPYSTITLGKNWDDTFAVVMTLATNRKTSHVDFAENYLDRPAIISVGRAQICTLPEPVENCTPAEKVILPHLSPLFQKTVDAEQLRERTSVNINFAYRPSDNLEMGLDIMALDNKINRRDYEIWYSFRNTNTLEEGKFNTSHALPFITSGTYAQTPQKFSTIVEVVQSDAQNIATHLKWMPNQALTLNNTFTYSDADYAQELGNAEVFYSNPSNIDKNIISEIGGLPVWVGDSGLDPITDEVILTPTGWVNYDKICRNCLDNTIQLLDYDNDRFTFSEYRNNNFYGEVENALSSYARANSISEAQSAWTLKSDLKWQPENSNTSVTLGWRFANRKLAQMSYRYLTNLGETLGAAEVAQFDENGKLIRESTFNPLQPPDNYNVGVRHAYYFDLCNNGGIALAKTCDINGDGNDDNAPYGPWIYALDATDGLPSFLSIDSSNSQPSVTVALYSPLLNNSNPFLFLPGSIPWQSYQQNPSAYKKLTRYLPSQTFRGDVYFIDAAPILESVSQWIDDRSPYSPTQKFLVPRNSFYIDQDIATLYSELHYISDDLPLTINGGLRLVQTKNTIGNNTINNEPKISLTNEDWEISGVGSGWSTTEQHKRYLNLLPSINMIWDFDEKNKIRIGAGKSITRPNFQLLGQGFTPAYRKDTPRLETGAGKTVKIATGGKVGNPDLEPEEVKQADISFEHYYGISDYAQLAFFRKEIDGEILQGIVETNVIDESSGGFTLVPVTLPINTRQSSVKGMEIALQNTWSSGIGINFNYTYIDSRSNLTSYSKKNYGIPGVSRHAINLASFFETDTFSVRLAMNWRSEYVDPYNTVAQAENLTAQALNSFSNIVLVRSYLPYLQADARITWHPDERIRFTFDVLNINKNPQQSYLEYKENISSNLAVETHYVLAVKVSL